MPCLSIKKSVNAPFFPRAPIIFWSDQLNLSYTSLCIAVSNALPHCCTVPTASFIIRANIPTVLPACATNQVFVKAANIETASVSENQACCAERENLANCAEYSLIVPTPCFNVAHNMFTISFTSFVLDNDLFVAVA